MKKKSKGKLPPVDLTAEQSETVQDIKIEKVNKPFFGVKISIEPKKQKDVKQ